MATAKEKALLAKQLAEAKTLLTKMQTPSYTTKTGIAVPAPSAKPTIAPAPAKSTALTNLLAKNAEAKAARDAASQQRKTSAITTTATKTAATAAAVRTFVGYKNFRKGYRTPIYKDAAGQEFAGPEEFTGSDEDLDTTENSTKTVSTGPSTDIQVLKNLLLGAGFDSRIIDSSVTFLKNLLSEGLDYDNATTIFLNSKEYTLKNGTKIESPFYAEYTYLNESLAQPKSSNELYNFVKGVNATVDKYNLGSLFKNKEAILNYAKNNVTVEDIDTRANLARLSAINTDPSYISALMKLGHISTAEGLTPFYLNNKIGQKQLELNLNTASLGAEAVRRAKQGIEFNKADIEKMGASFTAKGLNQAQTSQAASQIFENVGQALNPTISLSNIYEGEKAGTSTQIQSELTEQEYLGTESKRLKKLKELETRSYQTQSGNYTGRTTSYSNPSSAGLI